MTAGWWGLLGVLVGFAGISALWRRKQENDASVQAAQTAQAARGAGRLTADDPDIDREALEEAEREVRDLETDVKGRPLEDAVGDDWGPGTPKPPYV